MSERTSLWEFRHPTSGDAAYQRKIWESRCPELLATCDGLADALDSIREAWSVLQDWDVVPARISDDDRGTETWQAYNVIEAALLRPEDKL